MKKALALAVMLSAIPIVAGAQERREGKDIIPGELFVLLQESITELTDRILELIDEVRAESIDQVEDLQGSVAALEARVAALEAAPPDPTPTPTPATNFAERCKAAGVVLCDPLDTEGPYDGTGSVMLNPEGTEGIPTWSWWRMWRGIDSPGAQVGKPGFRFPELDSDTKSSGTGSLRFTYPGHSNSGEGGTFTTNFADDLGTTFGEGEAFFVQFRWRASCDFLYLDCDPTSPTYKTKRRSFVATNGVPTAFKLAIFSTADPEPGVSADSCTPLEIVLVHGPDHFLQAYQSCNWYSAFEEPRGSVFGQVQIDRQPGGEYGCWRFPDPNVNRMWGWGNVGPNCFQLDADEWITIQTMISIGTWQPERTGPKTSRLKVWAAHEGESQRLVVDVPFYADAPSLGASPADRSRKRAYGKLWLLPYMTAKDPAEAHPVGHIWYDELIVSRAWIGDPN